MCEFHVMVHKEAAVSSSTSYLQTHVHGHSPSPACCAGSAFCPRLHPQAAPMGPSHCYDLTSLVASLVTSFRMTSPHCYSV